LKPSSNFFETVILFSGYFTLGIFFTLTGLGDFWSPFLIIFAAGTMFLTYFLLLGPIQENSPGFHSVFVFVYFGVLYSLLVHPKGFDYALLGVLFIHAMTGVAMFIIKKIRSLGRILFNPERRKPMLMGTWLIYVLAASIPTSTGFERLEYGINIIPILSLGVVFGWLGPEVTYKVIKGVYSTVKAAAMELVFFYMFLEANPVWEPLISDSGLVNILTVISVPSMLVSRIILESIKN